MIEKRNILVIIGAMKSGTTFLYDLLIQHPSICPCVVKEPSYYTHDPNEKVIRNVSNYFDLWPSFDDKHHKYAIEASVNYTKMPIFQNAPHNMFQEKKGNYKFVYLVRNPIERIRSHIAFMEIYNRKQGNNYKNIGITPHMLDCTRYAYQLDQYVKYFPKNSIKIICFEDFINNEKDITNEIFSFLELLNYNVRLTNNKNSTSDLSYSKLTYVIRNLIPITKSIKKYIPSFLNNLLIDKNVQQFKLSDSQKKFITENLKDDLIRLKSVYNVDINKWNLDI